MATPDSRVTADQRALLEEELGRHHTVDSPPFERCACGSELNAGAADLDGHRLEIAFELGAKVAKRGKPRRKRVPASAVQRDYEIMSARHRVLVTQVFARKQPDGTVVIEIGGTYKPKPSALRRVGISFHFRPDHEVIVMNWLPPLS